MRSDLFTHNRVNVLDDGEPKAQATLKLPAEWDTAQQNKNDRQTSHDDPQTNNTNDQ
jgi:hypothetical protein